MSPPGGSASPRATDGPRPALSARELSSSRSPAGLGVQEADIPGIVELAVANPHANPRPVTRKGATALLEAAWSGLPPGTPLDLQEET